MEIFNTLQSISILNLIMTGLWIFGFTLMLWGTRLLFRHKKTPPPHLDAPFNLYPVSILKPLKGADPCLEENLKSFFHIDYPDYEVLFCVQDAKDPAYAIVKKLLVQYPKSHFKLIVSSEVSQQKTANGKPHYDINPKVNNIAYAYDLARNDIILISDSNVRVKPQELKRIVAHLKNDTGVITAIIAGEEAQNFAGQLECTYLNTFYARWMALTAHLGLPCVIGKSMLFRKSDAKRFGGIKTLACYLAEDYMAGEAMKKLGLKIVVQSDPVTQIVGKFSFRGFWDRHIRWARIRKAQSPLSYPFEPISNALISGVIGAYGFSAWIAPHLFIAFHLSVWMSCDVFLARTMNPKAPLLTPVYWILRELLAFPLWLHGLLGNHVHWRGQILKLETGGIVKAQIKPKLTHSHE